MIRASIPGVTFVAAFLVSCASTSAPRREPTRPEPIGELETPSIECGGTTRPATSWDVVSGSLQPGERVRAIDYVGQDLVRMHVQDGKRIRTLWFRKYGDGGLEEASPPTVGERETKDAG
jgi:hypothetical protein